LPTVQKHWLVNELDINTYDGSYQVEGVPYVKNQSCGFIIKPNWGLSVDVVSGKTILGPKKGNLMLAIIPDSTLHKSEWLEGQTSGVIDIGRFHYEDSQSYDFTIVSKRESGKGIVVPPVGTHSFKQDVYSWLKSPDAAVFSFEIHLVIDDTTDYIQEFTPLLVNLIKTQKSSNIGFHAEDKIEV